MKFIVGTSSYSVPEWKGSFYPKSLPAARMLEFYAERFSTVEVNYTFRRRLTDSVVDGWIERTPRSFRFACKAPQAITHFKRLKDSKQDCEYFLDSVARLGKRRGPVLFQLPPNFKKDLERLDKFLASIDNSGKLAFEFRHPSWFDNDEVAKCLRRHGCALCIADTDETPIEKIVSTAKWGYLRLRRQKYSAKALKDWLKKIQSQNWRETYVFFKHEETGAGPKFAAQFNKLAGMA
jgi:uncharacterized protein YecE (DUF72 family)